MSKIVLKIDSLAFSLSGAAHVIAQVQAGTALPQALSDLYAKREMPAQARGAIQDLAYRTMRCWGTSNALLALLMKKPPQPAVLHGLLSCALALLVDADPVYETFTIVDQAVTAAAGNAVTVHAKSVVNAVLRRFLRERDVLLMQARQDPQAVWNYPRWWIEEVQHAYPRVWQEILKQGNTLPPLTLRVNQRMTTMKNYLRLLSDHALVATQIGPHAVRLAQPVPVGQIPAFDQGWVSVQDAAAQLAAPLLDVQDGMRVLDACAAPGGKTGHLLELADVDLIALDQDAKRLMRVQQNLERLQLHATIKTGDASTASWWDGQPFDRIIADVPCTASGIVRRHPDIRWLRRKSDAARLATLSAKILDNLWQMLKPNGKLMLVTCSIWPHESEAQAAAFAARQQAIRLPAPGQLLPGASKEVDHDGLFYALFQKPAV